MRNMNIAAVGLATALAAGCSPQPQFSPTENPLISSTAEIRNLSPVTTVKLGETAFVIKANKVAGDTMIKGIQLTDNIYPRGSTDSEATTISHTPSRNNIQVSLHGRGSDILDNDGACETFRIEGTPTSLSAVALGGSENGVFLAWPESRPNFAYVCSFQNEEPERSEGIVLFSE